MSVEKFMACKGQFIVVEYTSTSDKPSAQHKSVVLTKEVRATVRAGINFANLQAVKDGIKAGTRGEVKGLQKGYSWDCFPYVIVKDETGQTYYRLYPSTSPSHRPTVRYLANGQEVTREVYLAYLTPSARRKAESGERPYCFNVKSENCRFPDETPAEVGDAEATDYPAVA